MKLCANEKTSAQRSIIGVCGGGLSQVGCPFLGGLRSEWMKSGHGGRGVKKAGNRWTYFVHGPRVPRDQRTVIRN